MLRQSNIFLGIMYDLSYCYKPTMCWRLIGHLLWNPNTFLFHGQGLFGHCAYPTRGTGKGDSTREFPLDLCREKF